MIARVIRGAIGFAGLLISDDLSMQALSGSLAERTRDSLAAGCEVALHCNGGMAEMKAVAAEADAPRRACAAARAASALARIAKAQPEGFDVDEARRRFDGAFGDRWAA